MDLPRERDLRDPLGVVLGLRRRGEREHESEQDNDVHTTKKEREGGGP